MNVLFVGKWDLAGAYIADRLIREGHSACWMTSESSRVLWNKKFKGNIYRGTWHREDYLRILKANSVDTVVFLTAKLRENYEELPEYESLMLDFTNLLNVLRNYPLKCLVYLSSVELDYQEIYTPVLTDLAAGEMLCKAYHTAYGLPVLVLRLGCVYGSFGLEDMGYTGNILKRLQESTSLVSQYSRENLVDVIYGEDVAMAVHLLLKLGKKGEYKVLTGHPVTMGDFYGILGKTLGKVPSVVWKGSKSTASEEYFVSGDQLRVDTGWMPFCLFQEKGLDVLKGALREKKSDKRREAGGSFPSRIRNLYRKPTVRAALETLLLFALTLLLLNYSKDVSDLKYVDIRLMFVAMVSSMHGVKFGLLAIFLACASYIYSLLASQVDISYLLYSVDTWVPFVVYAITGASIGYMTDRKQDEKENLQENYELLEDKYEFLKSIHGETLEIKGNLQKQIVTSKYSFGHAYEVAVELDTLKPELILLKVISILENIMDCDKAAVFLVNGQQGQFARLKACSYKLRETIPNSLDMTKFSEIYNSFRETHLFVNTALLPEYPDYSAPIYYHDQLYAFVAVYDIGVEKFTVYFQNLFKIIASLIEKNLVKALEYENIQHDALYYPVTELLYPKAFEDRLSVMRSESGDIAYSYVTAKVYPPAGLSQDEAASLIASVIRGSDCMGIDKDGDYAVILINMTPDHLDLVKKRFETRGMTLEAKERI